MSRKMLTLTEEQYANRQQKGAPTQFWTSNTASGSSRKSPSPAAGALAPSHGDPPQRDPAPTRNKYGATKCYHDRINFDSKGELARYNILRARERRGAISELVVHPAFPLLVNGVRIGTARFDFRYLENGQETIEDYKGSRSTETREFRRNVLHVKEQYGIDVRIVRQWEA